MARKKKIPLDKVEELGRLGLHKSEIAALLGISQATLYERMAKEPEILDAIERGRAATVQALSHVVIEGAIGKYARDDTGRIKKDAQGKAIIEVPRDTKLAIEALRTLGKVWNPRTVVELAGDATVNLNNSGLSIETQKSMAEAFLRLLQVRVEG